MYLAVICIKRGETKYNLLYFRQQKTSACMWMEKATGRSIAFSSFKITAYFNIGVHRLVKQMQKIKTYKLVACKLAEKKKTKEKAQIQTVVCVSGCTNRQDSLLHMFFKKSLQTSTLFVLSVFPEECAFQGSSLNVKSNNNSIRGRN
jgi:hypothetical protein